MKDFQFLQQKYTVGTYVNRQLTFVRGEGVYLYDQADNRYLDLTGSYGANIVGHNQPDISAALTAQLHKLTTLHGSFANDARAEASQTLVQRCGLPYTQVFWSSSGAEAI